MIHKLTAREVKALQNAEIEMSLMPVLGQDFFNPAKLGSGVGKGTIDALCDLCLIERGFSEYHRAPNYIRITEDGERCLNGGYTNGEVMKTTQEKGITFLRPRVPTWPVTERGIFR